MQHQRGNSHLAHLRGISQPRTLDFARDVMQLHVYLVPSWAAPSGRALLPPAGFRTTCAAMTSPCASQKTNLAVRGVHHASTCALLVRNLRRALCEQNTPRRSRRVSHTCPRREPIQSKFNYLAFVRPRDQLHQPLAFPDRASLSQPSTWGSRAVHGTDRTLAAV